MWQWVRWLIGSEMDNSILRRENDALHDTIARLEARLIENQEKPRLQVKRAALDVDKTNAQIDKIVTGILEGPGNIKFLPDKVERHLYISVLNAVFQLLNNIVDESSIKFAGHEISFNFDNAE